MCGLDRLRTETLFPVGEGMFVYRTRGEGHQFCVATCGYIGVAGAVVYRSGGLGLASRTATPRGLLSAQEWPVLEYFVFERT